MAIEAIGAAAAAAPAVDSARPQAGGGFGESLGKLLDATSQSDKAADTAVGQMMDKTGDVHEAMIALQQADLMMQLSVQVRNKLVQAYQEIMRMPV